MHLLLIELLKGKLKFNVMKNRLCNFLDEFQRKKGNDKTLLYRCLCSSSLCFRKRMLRGQEVET